MVFMRIGSRSITGSRARGKPPNCITAALFLISASLMSSSAAHAGELDRVVAFNIEAPNLDRALLEFGAQAHVQIMFACDASMVLLPARKLKGSYTGKTALAQILRGTHLTYTEHGRTLEILPQASTDPSASARVSKSSGKKLYVDPANSNNFPPKSFDPPVTHGRARGGQSVQALSEVIVTAQLYRQPAFDVPINLAIFSAKNLEDLRITSLAALQYDVPGLYINSGAGFSRLTIDGIGNNLGSGALVGEYIDEADITGEGETGNAGLGTGDISLTDVGRVEVLHGPQGTLYGDGAMGGVVRVITNEPDLHQLQFSSDVAALFSQYGAPSQHIQTVLNVPLVADTLGLRFAGDFEHNGGWVDEPEANAKNINSGNLTDVRLETLWRPSARLTVNAMQIIRRDTFGFGYDEDAQGNIAAPLPFELTTVPQGTQAFNLSNLTVRYAFPTVSLLSSSTYFTHNYEQNNTFSAEQTSPTTYVLYHPLAYTDEDYSEELRVSNTGHGPSQWMMGGFYKHYADTLSVDELLTYSTAAAPVLNIGETGLDTASNSTAGFANTSYALTRRLVIGVGVRYYSARETYNYPQVNYHGYAGLGVIPGKSEEANFSSTDPRAFVQYRVGSHVNTYASASKGFREGGFNSPGLPPFLPETLWRYDVGLKSLFLHDYLLADWDIFYSDYSNYVVEGFSPTLNTYYQANAGTAHIRGIAPSVKWRLNSAWSLGVNGEYTDARFVSISLLDTGYAIGDRVPLTTKYSFSGSVERKFQWDGDQGHVILSYAETSDVQIHAPGYIYPEANSAVMRFLNFNSDIDLNDNLSIGLFAQNLLNDRGYMDPFWLYGQGSKPQPRTFGVDFRVNLEGR